MMGWIYWDPEPSLFTLPYFHWPILWYSLFFAFGFLAGFSIFVRIAARYFLTLEEGRTEGMKKMKQKAALLADKLSVYVIFGTIVGARLGHFLFYEQPSAYLRDPLSIFYFWKGGLASHGAAVAIIFSVFLFSYRNRLKPFSLDGMKILDFLAVPAAFAGGCIRIGNFFNQEILGKATQVPWAVVFGHPFDQTLPQPRHPVQLYESLGYFLLFFLLLRLSRRPYFLQNRGKILGLFLILVFTFRFFIEFLKTEQSQVMPSTFFLTMGQILSLPAILLGCLFYSNHFLDPFDPLKDNGERFIQGR